MCVMYLYVIVFVVDFMFGVLCVEYVVCCVVFVCVMLLYSVVIFVVVLVL